MVDNLQVQVRQAAFRPAETQVESTLRTPLLRTPANSHGLLGESVAMGRLQVQLERLAATTDNVLIHGEPGTGKRLAARAIHTMATDSGADLAVMAASDGLAAIQQAVSRLSQSSSLTGRPSLILEGLGELSPAAQAELLQSLEGAVGDGHSNGNGNGHHLVKPRILAIFSGDAQRALTEGSLNRDVMQRLAPVQLAVPSLREREEDAVLLAQYFLALLNAEEDASKTLSGESLLFLRRYEWPGNIRELRSAVQRAFVLADHELQLAAAARTGGTPGEQPSLRIVVGTSLADAEKRMIVATLRKCGGNKTRAAALLGVSLKTLYNRLNGYRAQGVELSQVDPEFNEVAV